MENDLSIFVLDKNEMSVEIIKKYLQDLDITQNINFYNDYNLGFEAIKNASVNSIVIVDVENNDSDFIFLEQIKSCTSKILITSVNYSTDMIIKALRVGAKEFLPKPIIKNELERILKLLLNKTSVENEPSAKIISVYSNKGGIGKTTIATNLALELAKTTGDKVALLDLNLQLGDVSTFLNLNPTFDVAYVIKNIVEKKDDFISDFFEKYKDSNLYILSDPNYIEESESITPYQIAKLFVALKKVFNYIIIDMSSGIDPNSLQILDKSDLILFTTIVNIPAIRNCQRCLNLFRSRRYPEDKVKILINRYMENEDIKLEDIEQTLGEKIYWKIPNNYFSIMESINKGISVGEINATSNIANSFKDLAMKISDDIVEKTINFYKV